MPSKLARGLEFRRALGKPCPYCERTMGVKRDDPFPSRDHTHPRSKGGQHVVMVCSDCNDIKADMTMPQWEAFMAANPEWWRIRHWNRVSKAARRRMAQPS